MNRPTCSRSMLTLCTLALCLSIPLTANAELFAKKAPGGLEGMVPMMELEPELDYEAPPQAGIVTPVPAGTITAKAVVVDINSEALNYDKDHDVYVATGDVHIVISEQNSELFADKVTYDQNQDLLIAEGNVVIVKNGQRTDGTYAKISLTQESALINDFAAEVNQVRIKAKTAFLDNKFQQFENGRLIITPALLKAQVAKGGKASGKSSEKTQAVVRPDDETLSNLVGNTRLGSDTATVATGEEATTGIESKFKMHVKEIEIHQNDDGYDKVYMKWPSLSFGKFKVGTLPSAEFSYDEQFKEIDYLGPDIGYDPDYGGLYGGPGWDFQLGRGSVRVSPILSMGGMGRKRRGGSMYEDRGFGPGVGGVLHYRSHNTMLDLAYNSRVGQPVVYAERKLFDGKTKLLASMNEDYNEGFMGYERPGFGIMIADTRKVAEIGKFGLYSYGSAGFFKDEFFPLNRAENFVMPEEGATPGMAGRVQLQADFRSQEPLLRVGNFMNVGLRANASMAGYTTGDFVGILRGGPNVNFKIGKRFDSSIQYYMAATAGETPFIFDTYYQGRQNIRLQNNFQVNDYLTIGMRSDISLLRDNDQNDLFTGNALYVLVGPKSVKLNLAYDVVRQRSYFGLKFFPGNGTKAIDYDTMKVFQPEMYSSPWAQ